MMSALNRLRSAIAKRRLLREAGVAVASDAKVQFHRISFRHGCRLDIGKGSILEGAIVFERDGAAISIGENTFIGNSLLASAESIEVGDDVLMAWGCGIVDHNSHSAHWSERQNDVRNWYRGEKDWTHVPRQPVRIGNKAWVGFNVIILKGVTIGEGAVVGAGSVVTRDVAPFTVVAGNPARVIRELEGPGGG